MSFDMGAKTCWEADAESNAAIVASECDDD